MAASLFGVSLTSFAAEEKALMEPVKSSEEMFP